MRKKRKKQTYRNGIHGIIDAQSDQAATAHQIQTSSNGTRHDGGPRFHNTTTGRDAHETAQRAIHGKLDIKEWFARDAFQDDQIQKQGHETGRATGQGRIDRGQGCDICDRRAFGEQGRAGIESVPTKP
jgi:hypothetical protein